MKLITALVAESVSRDADTNSVSVFNLLEGVAAESFPVVIGRASFVALWQREPSDQGQERTGTFTISLNGENIVEKPVNAPGSDKRTHRLFIRMGSLVIPGPGTLRFTLTLNGAANEAVYEIEVRSLSSGAITQTEPRTDATTE